MVLRKIQIIGAIVAVGLAGVLSVSLANGLSRDGKQSRTLIKSGQKVAFLGASISEFGWTNSNGYIQLVVKCLAENDILIEPIPAGVSGNTSREMLARLDQDVISKKPDWVTIDAGGNDVWHKSVTLAEYKKNMTAIVDKAQAAGIHVILQTCTPIGEDQKNEFNPKLAQFNQFQQQLARQKHCVLADLHAEFLKTLKTKTGKDNLLTTDGVHMNDRGNRVMAYALLKAFRLTDKQIAKTIDLSKK